MVLVHQERDICSLLVADAVLEKLSQSIPDDQSEQLGLELLFAESFSLQSHCIAEAAAAAESTSFAQLGSSSSSKSAASSSGACVSQLQKIVVLLSLLRCLAVNSESRTHSGGSVCDCHFDSNFAAYTAFGFKDSP
jgi:hypothetical protein